jgi:hypothetical protein
MSQAAGQIHRDDGVAWEPTDDRADRYARAADSRARRRLQTAAAATRRSVTEAVAFFRAWP